MGSAAHKNPIDRISHADSVMSLLSRLNVAAFPGEERIAVATVQVEALDEWLAADLENITARAPIGRHSAAPAEAG